MDYIRLPTCILVRNNPAKFYPNPISNNGALGFFEEVAPRRRKTKKEEEEE